MLVQQLKNTLQFFSKTPSLDATKSLHALIITMGTRVTQPIFANNVIVSSYSRSGELFSARKVFDEMTERNVVSYNTIIGAYGRNADVNQAWEMFYELRICGFEPTQQTFTGILSCARLGLARGPYLHCLVKKIGFFYCDAYVGTALLGMYGRNGCFDEAFRVFDDMPEKNIVTWNSMISVFGHHGFGKKSLVMFRELIRTGGILSESSYVGVLSGFVSDQDVKLGEQVHGLLIKNGVCNKDEVRNALVNMYVKCYGAEMGEKLFVEGLLWDTVSWNTIIRAVSKSGTPEKAVDIFFKMCCHGVLPDTATFVRIMNICSSMRTLIIGKIVHAKIIKYLFHFDADIGSSLIHFYGKFNELEDAQCCFDDTDKKSVLCWNILISGYSNKRGSLSVLQLRKMIQSGYVPNESTLSAVLKSTFTSELLQLHSLVIKTGYEQNEYVYYSLITSYAKNGLLSDALTLVPTDETPLPVIPCNIIAGIYNRTGQYHKTQELYSSLEEPDIVSWNILLAACARNGDYKEVFELFRHMQVAQINPDKYTCVSLFNACTKTCNLALGSSLHALIIKASVDCDTFVHNIMIDMYGKCGSLINASKVFDEITGTNVISWTALISALGLHGHAVAALKKFEEMVNFGYEPDEVALLAVLSACRYGGLVTEAKELFEKMRIMYGIEPKMDHYHVMVDLLTRCGYLKEAEQFILSMPFLPNARIWRCFLEVFKRQQNVPEVLTVDTYCESALG